MPLSSHPTHAFVRKAYGRIAASGGGCCGPQSSCCGGGRASEVAQGVGYSDAELATLPEGANIGLSCGNPTALAGLKPGETVLDLGSGAGLDVFLAAQRVGPEGRAIGVDMTPEMLVKARSNAMTFRERTGLANVEFHQGQIEALPLADASVDVVLSNCVLNLSPDQATVWKEIAEAGLVDPHLVAKDGNVEAMLPSDDPMTDHLLGLLPAGTRPSDFIASLIISARKS